MNAVTALTITLLACTLTVALAVFIVLVAFRRQSEEGYKTIINHLNTIASYLAPREDPVITRVKQSIELIKTLRELLKEA